MAGTIKMFCIRMNILFLACNMAGMQHGCHAKPLLPKKQGIMDMYYGYVYNDTIT